jgi:uncharacterized membrane protein YczE
MISKLALPIQDHYRQHGTMLPSTQPGLLRRLAQLYAGLVLYGFSAALILLSGLGNVPWDVLHQGLSVHTGIGTGVWVCLVGALLLLLWIPLRQRPGLGTVSNVVVLGVVLQAMVDAFDQPAAPAARAGLLVTGILLNGVATGLYIGARFGPGPRDGLMTGLAARGHSLRVVRTAIELTVLASGWLLGGTVGLGTVAYALAIGPLAKVFVPLLEVPAPIAPIAPAAPQRRDDRWRRNGAASSPRPVADSTIGTVSSRRPWRWTLVPSHAAIAVTSPTASASACGPSSDSSDSQSCAAIRQPSA